MLLKNGVKDFKEAKTSSCSPSGDRRNCYKVLKSLKALSNNLDESLQLPGPSSGIIREIDSDEEEDSDDANHGFSKEDAKLCYEDWLFTLQREDTQMMAMMISDNYIERFGLLKTSAAKEGLLLGINEKTIRRWKAEFHLKG